MTITFSGGAGLVTGRAVPMNTPPKMSASRTATTDTMISVWFFTASASRLILTIPDDSRLLVAEVPHTGKDHGHAQFVRRSDDFAIPLAATRLDDGANPRGRRSGHTVRKRKEGV